MNVERQLSEYDAFVSDEALLKGLADRHDDATTDEMAPLVEELCDFYSSLKSEQTRQDEIYLPGGEWQVHIDARSEYYQPWLDHDIAAATETLGNFWRGELGIVQQYASYNTLKDCADARVRFSDQLAYDFMVWSNLFGADVQELAVPRVGNPWGYYIENVLVAPKALRYHVLATQINEITRDAGHPVISEIGAGYGGVAHYLLRGDAPLTYIDFDLPEILVLIAYYLRRTVPHRKVLLFDPSVELNAETLSAYDVILMPNWMLPKMPAESVDLFFNTFSLSEMPMRTLTEYIKQIERCCRGYFLHNNMDRADVVQSGYERIPSSKYPIDNQRFKLLYKRYDLFQRLHSGRDGDYREYLYQRV
jgi:putative sugar O-methyltransferase